MDADIGQLVSAGNTEEGQARRLRRSACIGLALSLSALALAYHRPIAGLVQLACADDLYSYVLLIPFLSFYLGWMKRDELVGIVPAGSITLAAATASLGLALLVGSWFAKSRGWQPAVQDEIGVLLCSFLLFGLASGFFFLGKGLLGRLAFPVALLFFVLPFPKGVENAIELFFQHTSADATAILFSMSGEPVVRSGLEFHLPGITMEVARECSGIRSTLVLFILSLVAGDLFLNSWVHRLVLALIVIPLGILRNGIRILTIGLLCINVGPHMINSWIHRSGGPLFFIASLLPFSGS